MRRTAALPALLLVLLAAACGSGEKKPHQIGDESFTSSAPGGGRGTGAEDGAGAPAGPEGPTTNDGSGSAQREVEESDLFARMGTTLLVHNAWRGLQVVDLADPAHPKLVARLPLSGTPAGLYLRGTTALVLARDHLAWTVAEDGPAANPGSRLWTVDVSDPKKPEVLAEVALDDQVQDSRLVGDVLYLFSGGWSWWWYGPVAGGGVARGAAVADVASPWTPGDWRVASWDVSDLAAPAPVDAVTFPSATWGWDLHADVTDQRITISSAGWDGTGAVTRLQAVDASDPGGDLALGAAVDVRGTVTDRWGMDLDEETGTFRVVSAEGWNAGARLTVLDWAEPGAVTKRSELFIQVEESLTAARFDGERGYLVTAARIDPLWVVDLRDPSNPSVTGELEMPGQLDHLQPRGDRLLALGHTNETGKPFQLHVSLIDVSDPAAPALLARRPFGPDWAFLPATADDLHKAFVVLGDLVLVPFEGWDQAAQGWVGGTQLLTLAGDTLTLGGFVPHAGGIQRALDAGTAGILAAFSNELLQTIDATDRARPFELARIDLARSVTSIAVVGAAAAELAGEPWRGSGELVVVPSADPDAATPTARFSTGSAWGRLFRNGTVVWTFLADWRTGQAVVEAFDLANPTAPVKRGRLELPRPTTGGWWWAGEAVQAGAALAIRQESWDCGPSSCTSNAEILVVDLANPDAPALAAKVPLPDKAWTGALRAVGTDVWYSQYAWVGDRYEAVRYTVGRIALADPRNPVVGQPVNVPGQLFSASDDGSTVYTEEIAWPDASLGSAGKPTTWLHALALTPRGTARLEGSVELPGYLWGAVRSGRYAYVAGSDWDWTTGSQGGLLAAVDLGTMRKLDVQPVESSWPQVLAAAGGKLFVSQSWPVASVLVYGLDGGKPAFEQAVTTMGWSYEVVVEGGYAYLPAGPYGVTRIALSP